MRAFAVAVFVVAVAACVLVDAKPLKRTAKHAISKSLIHHQPNLNKPHSAKGHKARLAPHSTHAKKLPFHPQPHAHRPLRSLEEETTFNVIISEEKTTIDLPYNNWYEVLFWKGFDVIKDDIGEIDPDLRPESDVLASEQWLDDHHHIAWAALHKVLFVDDPNEEGLCNLDTETGDPIWDQDTFNLVQEKANYVSGPAMQICSGPLSPENWRGFTSYYVFWYYVRFWCPTYHAEFVQWIDSNAGTMETFLDGKFPSEQAWWRAAINPFFGPDLTLQNPVLKFGATNMPATLTRPGRTYTRGAILGQGDYGAVYSATYPVGNAVAIKMVIANYFVRWQEGAHPASIAEAPDEIAELRAECTLMHRLHQLGGKLANVVDCIDDQAMAVDNPRAPRFIVLEKIVNLGWAADKDSVIPLMKQLVELVDAINTARVAHRDLYARNLAKVAADNEDGFVVKVFDFGISQENVPKSEAREEDFATLTSTMAGGYRNAAIQDGPITTLWRQFKDPDENDDDEMKLLRKKVKQVYTKVSQNKDPSEIFDFTGL